ncbi:MAG: hypothetical protein WCW13_01445 [archaeon]|jgi:hypothetical protein
MGQTVTMDLLYKEILSLKKEVETVKRVLISDEKVSAKELAEIKLIKKEMLSGKEKSMKEVFG